MSWEDMGEYEMPCPCGKGKVIVKSEMDDWNRFRSYETILCDKCKEKYNLERKLEKEIN